MPGGDDPRTTSARALVGALRAIRPGDLARNDAGGGWRRYCKPGPTTTPRLAVQPNTRYSYRATTRSSCDRLLAHRTK